MIDIHNHIVYDCDDGAKSVEQSIIMIKAAREAGVTAICFTPHYMEDGYKTDRAVLEEKVDILRRSLTEANIDMELYLGEEVFIFPNLPEQLDRVVCLNDSKYILFELPLVEDISYIDDVVYRLFTYGKVPVLAHPERYLATAKDFSFVERLSERGVLLQVNLNSLIGHYGRDAKKIATKLLKQNMVQFVASDAHSSASYYAFEESMPVLRRLVGEEKFKEITEDNQRKVLLNEDIEVDGVIFNKKEKSRGLFSLLRNRGE